jgi:hydrogenase maturation protein HypF
MGAELKNTVAVGVDAEVYLSPHIGDLETPEAVAHCEKVADRLPEFLGVHPECVAVDLHPDMHSTRMGTILARRWGVPLVPIQHHHAHAAACMAEHGADDALAIIFDGIGLGADGSLRGGELFHLPSLRHCLRLGTFEPAPLPGGDAAVREPRRQIVARWTAMGLHPDAGRLARIGADEHAAAVWSRLAEDGVLAPPSHAAGRVFDAVAAALNLAPDTVTYEGQTAIRLEAAAASCLPSDLASPPRVDPFAPGNMWRAAVTNGELRIDWSPLFRLLYEAPPSDADASRVAAAFHEALADAAARMARHGRDATGCRTVVLSGGVMMNRILDAWIRSRLIDGGFRVLTPSAVPPNDGGVSLGQCVIAGG